MNSEYTIVVPDADVLSCVCGTNDSNLKLIEEYLGVPVFTRGNEISVDDDDPSVRQEFRFIIDRIVDEIGAGGRDSRGIVAAVLGLEDGVDLEKVSILIPGGGRRIYPRTRHQADYIQALRRYDMVFCTGAAGSGKTFLAAAEALRLVMTRRCGKLVITRPVVESGESLGFLPGGFERKIDPYLRPLYDAMEAVLPRETVRRMVDSGMIEIVPLAYMRGRTLAGSVVILDEAQNTTRVQMKMFLTRMGGGSKVFITGDETQTDLPGRVPSGLTDAVRLLSGVDGIGFVGLSEEDVVRNPLVKKIIKAYGNEQNELEQ